MMELAELEHWIKLAKAASQGNWHTDPLYRGWIFADDNYIATTHRGRESMIVPNADYIAYASPQRVLALIERARERWHTWNVVDKPCGS